MAAVSNTPEERIGTRLEGKYELIRVCGQGGMGVVLEGVHVWTGRRVAVKLLHNSEGSSAEHLERLLREARTATAVRHPNVVDVLDMGRDGATPFIVMDYLQGQSLESLLDRQRRLSPEAALEILLPVMGAVAIAHDLGVVHRDLKPANIFLSRDPAGHVVPKLLDFGLAQSVAAAPGVSTRVVLGTPCYMSPEQARGHSVGPEADVWAMGVVLYRAFSGKLPFSGATPTDVLASIVQGRPHSLASFGGLPPRLCAAIERALSIAPRDRYPDMRSFARALVTTAKSSDVVVPASPDPVGLPDSPAWIGARTDPRSDTLEDAPALLGGATTAPHEPERRGARQDSIRISMSIERAPSTRGRLPARVRARNVALALGAIVAFAALARTREQRAEPQQPATERASIRAPEPVRTPWQAPLGATAADHGSSTTAVPAATSGDPVGSSNRRAAPGGMPAAKARPEELRPAAAATGVEPGTASVPKIRTVW